jgi:hypothetical protein
MAKPTGQKGYVAEEALRAYFSSTGYFAVRSIPFAFRHFDVTDVDLWLYIKNTSLSAERTCVDVKRKKSPQAMERVLWTKGLKEVLGVDRAIVVTPDNRTETREFGANHDVQVLQGDFLQRVIAAFPPTDRMTEEELLEAVRIPCIVAADVQWRVWLADAKAKLLDNLNFDGCNSFLVNIKLALEEYAATGKTSEVPVRLLYIQIAYLLICLDYASRPCVSMDGASRMRFLTDGFRYGEAGRQRTEEVVQMAIQLLAEAGKTDLGSGEALRREVARQVAEYRAEMLGEYFAKSESLKALFSSARTFESMAYARSVVRPDQASADQKALIGLLCDHVKHDRKDVI